MTRQRKSGSTETTEGTECGDSADRIVRLLRHPARRRVLTALADREPADGSDRDTVAITPQKIGLGLYWTELYHWHLPKLAEAEFIDWDPTTNTIKRGPRFDGVRPMLERTDSRRKRPTDTSL